MKAILFLFFLSLSPFAKSECNKNNFQNYIHPTELRPGVGAKKYIAVWQDGEQTTNPWSNSRLNNRKPIPCDLRGMDFSSYRGDGAGSHDLASYWIRDGTKYKKIRHSPGQPQPKSYDVRLNPSFAGADLTGANFYTNKKDGWRGPIGNRADFTGTNLTNADLRYMKGIFREATLTGANLQSAGGDFSRADATNANMQNMIGPKLSGTILKDADISGSKVVYEVAKADFTNVTAHDVEFFSYSDSKTYIEYAKDKFTEGLQFGNANLDNADFTGSVFRTADEHGNGTSPIDFRKAQNFEKATWNNVTFKGENTKFKHNKVFLTESQLDHLIANSDKIKVENIVFKTDTREVTDLKNPKNKASKTDEEKKTDKENNDKTKNSCVYKGELVAVDIGNCGKYCYGQAQCPVKGFDAKMSVFCQATDDKCPSVEDCINQETPKKVTATKKGFWSSIKSFFKRSSSKASETKSAYERAREGGGDRSGGTK